MADRVEPEIPKGHADGLKAAVPPIAETHFTPEISAPMLDVHAPHATVHTWKDFVRGAKNYDEVPMTLAGQDR